MSYIILDRDGVINFDSETYIKTPAEWNPIPGSLEAIAKLTQNGWNVIIATNQSGVSRKLYDLETLDDIHKKLLSSVKAAGGNIAEIFFCPHHPDEKCICRKPQPGMLHDIAKKYQLDLSEVYFVGDSLTDVQAAVNAGCKPVLVLTGNGKDALASNPDISHVRHFADLADAVEFFLNE